jgi:hypothetical protein
VGQGLGVLGNFGRSKQLRGEELPKETYKRSGGPVVNIPVAQAFRPEVYSRSGAVTVGAIPLTLEGKGPVTDCDAVRAAVAARRSASWPFSQECAN